MASPSPPTGTRTPDTLRLGSWNMLRDRPPDHLRDALRDITATYRLHALALQECRDYLRVLAPPTSAPPVPGYSSVVLPRARPGSDQLAFLVRSDILRANPRVVPLGGDGWTTLEGAHHVPTVSLAVTLAGWLRVLDIHLPPGIDWPDGNIQGPPERVEDYIANARRIVSYAHTRRTTTPGKALTVLGDWNCHPAWDHGRYSAEWVAARARLTLPEPPPRGMDFPATSHNASLDNFHERDRYGSDHPLVTFALTFVPERDFIPAA